MRTIIFSICLVSILLSMGTACEENPCCPEEAYRDMIFELPFSITPIKDTFAIGDTLWLTADFPDTVKDHKSGNYYHVPPTFDFKTRIGFRNLVSNEKYLSEQPGFTGAFDIVNRVGKVENLAQTFGDFRRVYQEGRYKARIGIIPRQEGVVVINFLDGWGGGGVYVEEPDITFIDLGKTSSGHTIRPVLRNIYHIVNGGDTTKTNFGLFSRHCKAASISAPSERNEYYEQKGTFTFVVKDK